LRKTAVASSAVFLRFAKYWLPVLIWMGVIFAASTDMGSTRHTSRFIGPFLRWIYPAISDDSIYGVQFAIRKTGHVTEYALLALLLWRACRQASLKNPWNPRHARLAVIGAGLYAISDEFHQSFVSTRQGSGWDVLLDTFGAAVAMVMLWAYGRWRRHW
jgi:VanZ family protein